MTENKLTNNEVSSLCVRERFRFLFDNLDIDEFKLISAKKEKIMLDEKIKKIKDDMKRQKRKEEVQSMAENMKDEISNYLVKVSKPKNDFEKMLVDKMVKELGTVTTVVELSKFLKMNKTCLYKAMDNGEILSFKRGRRRYVITEGVLPFLRD
jgi:predicted RNase H-like nuclease (RuvC/YqgF family)